MDIDIELRASLSQAQTDSLREKLGPSFELVHLKSSGDVCVRPLAPPDTDLSLDKAIQSYLRSIEHIGHLLEQCGGILRVGVFFEENEAAAFSVVLSDLTIQVLAKYRFSCDINCYPCV